MPAPVSRWPPPSPNPLPAGEGLHAHERSRAIASSKNQMFMICSVQPQVQAPSRKKSLFAEPPCRAGRFRPSSLARASPPRRADLGSGGPTHRQEASMSTDLEILTALNRDYIASVQNGDVRRFDEILAEDFLCSNPDGSLVDRQQFLAQTARPVTISGLAIDDVRIRLL